ncbi:hypothetical protein V8C42DRAFT_343681 [Trichoderma barbatum]
MSGRKDITVTSNDVPTVMLDAIRKRLKDVVNAYPLDINATYTESRHCLRVIQSLTNMLLSCPHLCILKLDIYQPQSGCMVYGLRPTYRGCGFNYGECPPPLEVLELTEYTFGRPAPGEKP